MWKCQKCEYKNSNNSEKCHGKNCDGNRGELKKNIKQVLDSCPKCIKETVFVFERNKMVEVREEGLGGSNRVKTRVEKRYRCTECQSLCRQTGRSKQVPQGMVLE